MVAAACSLVALALATPVAGTETEEVDFNSDIRPILTRNCTACHGGVKQAADLSFVYAEDADWIIEPGDPDSSYLVDRITAEDESEIMPPPDHGPRLPDEEVELIRRWIQQGGQWPKHWAYEQPTRHEAPEVLDPEWARQPMDAFLLAKLDERGVQPAPDEQPDRWLRRVTLDLIGLPPTLDERSAFLTDVKHNGETAYAAAVDRLLDSPRFGERWASVWFDQVRYADSRGLGEDTPRDIWKYRDWVIDALNSDLPYDQFTIKQLAGDLLPNPTIEDRIATAVHRLTQTNEEGGTDDEEFRVAAVLDRVHTTWQTWQGLTMGCVQCHDHPYDPLKHEEHYRSVALFNNTADVDLSDDWPLLDVPLDQANYERATSLEQEVGSLQEATWRERFRRTQKDPAWEGLSITKASTSNSTKVVVEKGEEADDYHTVSTVSSNPTISTVHPVPEGDLPLTGLRMTLLPLEPEKAAPDAEVGFVLGRVRLTIKTPGGEKPVEVKVREIVGDEPFPYFDPNESLEENNEGYAAYTRIHYGRNAVLVFDEPLDAPAGSVLTIKARYPHLNLAAFPLVARRGSYAVTRDPALTELRDDAKLNKQREQLAKLKAEREAIESVATPVLTERPEHLARESHVFIRGLFLTKGDEVQPGVPESLNARSTEVPDRLAFAEWLVDADNPLTARVAVNRFWAQLFGNGLVATEEDFGSSGERPSHPELLDDLAVRFREEYDWSVKRLIREYAMSRAYRQSSKIRPELLEEDSANRLIARGPRHTLPAEALRDQMLAISGLLSDKMHGPPVYPPLPSGVWRARRGSWKTPKKGEEDRYRRSVYTHVKRSVPFPTFAAFDAPSREFCSPKRLRSNTPLQSLMLLNDSAAVECAQAFTDWMQGEAEELPAQITIGFLRATCRKPSEYEVEQLLQLHKDAAAHSDPEVAMQSVASVLMNLDEVINK